MLTKSEESGSATPCSDPAVSTVEQPLSGKVKKVSPFRYGETRSQPCLSILSPILTLVPGGKDQVTQQDIKTSDDNLRVSFCEHAVPVEPEELSTSFRIFKDKLGQCWKCYMMLTCDHAVVIHGVICSCRVRTKEIQAMQAGET
jgi:hypothetical protein